MIVGRIRKWQTTNQIQKCFFHFIFVSFFGLGFYLSPDQSVCAECDCHPMGAAQRGCERQTGQCVCVHPSVGGRRCDQCHEMFFGFNPGLGR